VVVKSVQICMGILVDVCCFDLSCRLAVSAAWHLVETCFAVWCLLYLGLVLQADSHRDRQIKTENGQLVCTS
jgi:hypothetical protein